MTVLNDLEKVKLYQDRVKAGENSLERWSPKAKQRMARYRNDAFEDDFTQDGHRISTPTGTAIIDAMYSSLTATDVEFHIDPRAYAKAVAARVAEKAVMDVWDETKASLKARYATKDALVVGIGWNKVGYDYASHDEVQPKTPEELDAEVDTIYGTALANGATPETLPDPDSVRELVDPEKVVEVVDRDRVVVDYVPWDRVVYDPTAKRVEDIKWIAQITYLTELEFKGNPMWREYVKNHSGTNSYKPLDDLGPDSRAMEEADSGTFQFRSQDDIEASDDDARYKVIEFWDLVQGTICTFPASGDFLLYEQANPFAFQDDMEDRNPFVPLVLRHDPDHVRGISDMELIEPALRELNRYRSALLNYLERYHPKVLVPSRAIGDTARTQMEAREPSFVELEDNIDASQIKELNMPQMPQEMFNMANRIEDQIREATGVSEVMRGLFPDRKRTATETAEVVAASSVRQSEKRSLMEDFYSNIAKRILWLLQTFGEGQIARIAEQDEDVDWVWSAEDITMEADLRIVLAPKVMRDQAWREERAMKLMSVVSPLPEANREGLLRKVLLDMGFSMAEIREVVNTPEDMEAQAQREAAQQADATAMQAEAAAVGQASGDPTIPGGVNDPLTVGEAFGPEGVMQDAAESMTGPMDILAGP